MFKGFLSEKGISVGFILPIAFLIASIIWVGYSVVWKNINAKDVVFSYSALVAAFVMFLLNITFSLKSEVIQKTIPIHLLHEGDELNIHTASIKRPLFLDDVKSICNEIGIPKESDVIKSKIQIEESVFKEKVNEYLKLTVISTILEHIPDWKMKEKKYLFTCYSSFNNKKEGSNENSYYDIERIFKETKSTLYSHCKEYALTDGITLPPKTTITGDNNKIILDNKKLKIKISFEMANTFKKMPFKYSGKSIQFSMGENKKNLHTPVSYEANINLEVLYKSQRSSNPLLKEQQAWVEKLFLTLEESLLPYKNS